MIPRRALAPGYDVSRLIVGGWQFSSGHRTQAFDADQVVDLLVKAADLGVTTFDCADIYSGVEELFGRFLRRWRSTSGASPIQVHTKFVPDLDALPTMNRHYVERIIDRSLRRLGVERLDLVQFYWWDHDVPGFEETGQWLTSLKEAGKIRLLAGTNLNVERTRRLLDAGVPLVADQVQYSVLDRRPERTLVDLATERGIQLLCYGALAGGLISDRWLGQAAPEPGSGSRSLVKYRLLVDELGPGSGEQPGDQPGDPVGKQLGGWPAFQRLLTVLRRVADTHATDVAAVALRFVLDQEAVAAVVTGATRAEQVARNLEAFRTELSAEDHGRIREALGDGFGPPGDIYDLEGDRTGRHGQIMRYNLNED